MNNLRHVELILYKLERQWGLPVTLRKPVSNENDVTTGRSIITWQDFDLRRVIRLPSDQLRAFIHDLAHINASKNFAYGTYYEANVKIFIIRQKDIPKIDGERQEINSSWTLVCEDKNYEIVDIQEAENHMGYLIKAKNVDSSPIIPTSRGTDVS